MFSIGCLLVNSLLEIAFIAISLILCEIFINMSKYKDFCKTYDINPEIITEDSWYEDDEDIFYCDNLPTRNISTTKFEF